LMDGNNDVRRSHRLEVTAARTYDLLRSGSIYIFGFVNLLVQEFQLYILQFCTMWFTEAATTAMLTNICSTCGLRGTDDIRQTLNPNAHIL